MPAHRHSPTSSAWYWGAAFLLLPGAIRGQSPGPARWVISSLHPDPTPAIGAPEAEYISLYAFGEAQWLDTQGLILSWNGHHRDLPAGQWPGGTTLVVHREADSAHFEGWTSPRIGLTSWPALVNGGTLVSLLDSSGGVVDAVLYDEPSLQGGGRPLLRRNPAACGALLNLEPWSEGQDPFAPLQMPMPEPGVAWTLEAMQEGARAFDRLVLRGLGSLEWRLPGPVDPRSMKEAKLDIGGVRARSLAWESDSVVSATWGERAGASEASAPETPPLVRLGPIRACAPGELPGNLFNGLVVVPASGEVEVVGMLADPLPDDPFSGEERITLVNQSEAALDAAVWDWGGARLTRRRILESGGVGEFSASQFEGWPGMSNAGGAMELTGPGGSRLVSWSWSPCDHSVESLDGQGIPLERQPGPGAAWHTEGHPVDGPEPVVLGFGCPRDWTGGVSHLAVHLGLPAAFLDGAIWRLEEQDGTELKLAGDWSPHHPRTLRLERTDGSAWPLDWPGGGAVEGVHPKVQGMVPGSEGEVLWSIQVACPPEPYPHPVSLRIGEALWDAEDGGGEFVEVENAGASPVDLRGLQATEELAPDAGEWRTWVDADVSLVLQPGEVMAFGRCPRWFRAGHTGAGNACWPVESWSALPDDGGILALRLPSLGPDPFDEISWNPDMRGPWWWKRSGWSWTRSGPGPADWGPSADGGSPGSRNGALIPECGGDVRPFQLETGLNGLPVLHWHFPAQGHGLLLRMVEWPGGAIRATFMMDLAEEEGTWAWDGRDGQDLPVPPGDLIWDLRWWGRTCSGRWRERIRVPGHR